MTKVCVALIGPYTRALTENNIDLMCLTIIDSANTASK